MQKVEISKTDVLSVLHRHINANISITCVCENKRAEQSIRKQLRGSCKITHASAINAVKPVSGAIVVDVGVLTTSVVNQLKRQLNDDTEVVVYYVQ